MFAAKYVLFIQVGV